MENYTEEEITNQTTALITYDVQTAVIDALRTKAHDIKLKSWQDEENYKLAKSTRSEINNLFKKLDRRRIDIKKAIEDSAQSVLIQIKEPIDYLDKQIAIRDLELKRQKEEAELAIQKVISERSQALQAQGVDTSLWLLHPEACSEEKYQGLLARAIEDKKRADEEKEALELAQRLVKAEQERKDLELEKLRAENEKLNALVVKEAGFVQGASEKIIANLSAPTFPKELPKREKEILAKYPTDYDKIKRIMQLEDELNDLQITNSTYISGDLF